MADKKRLIDANKLSEHKFQLAPTRYRMGWNDAIDAVMENAPTVEAVEVVRCKNCAFYEENEAAHTTLCRRGLERLFARPDGYCSYGERRTDNEG